MNPNRKYVRKTTQRRGWKCKRRKSLTTDERLEKADTTQNRLLLPRKSAWARQRNDELLCGHCGQAFTLNKFSVLKSNNEPTIRKCPGCRGINYLLAIKEPPPKVKQGTVFPDGIMCGHCFAVEPEENYLPPNSSAPILCCPNCLQAIFIS